MSVNKCIFIGNLTRDPEVKHMQSGDMVVNFSIACNEKWKDKAGEKKESVEFVNVVIFGKLAEIAGQYLKKGSQVYIQGKLKTEKYQDKTSGQERFSTKIVADEMQMLGGKSNGGKQVDRNGDERPSTTGKPAYTAGDGGFDDFDTSEIPF